ncbi:Polycystic kidney disease protein 1-like 3 [Actinoplanes sp. SE50]|uniref:hypothetical protein n=1 Tax=unclassified Actinoplanes TaxID=2626549 RepID=UPI00023ECDCC|nr:MULTISPECIES: hypothetical protein [unclassified Actinoplanes]AEV81045.1 Polycystic kidney disease protein 1-like 3 [Actinoplanes sp. SE50/110]ATO79446.1 Polycystic kidney disease protein 1-like 3 [Actinoplanes sp. SE50]SLL96846.1 hypothetical protein ACSP50_0033 [Actinoplanes sp. SE50/110]
MAGWRVERTPRTASRSVPVTPGGSPLMPPHSQGAERRPERRAGRAGSRWVLRAFVVGGLAGAAWLLTGAAAHAAGTGAEPVPVAQAAGLTENPAGLTEKPAGLNEEPAPVAQVAGPGEPLGAVLDGDVESAPAWLDENQDRTVGDLLKAAVQPLETHHHIVTSLPAATHDEPAIDPEPHGEPLPTTAAPLRSSSGTADAQRQPATEGPAADSVAPPALSHPFAPVGEPAPATFVKRAGTRVTRAPAGDKPARRVTALSRSRVHRHAPAARPVAPEAIRQDMPGGDGPAPARTNLGAVSGIPASSGSGGNTENGSSAVLPTGTANGPVACHRCPVAPDVDARRNDAVAPTVSPD